jgi:hypothetical protein
MKMQHRVENTIQDETQAAIETMRAYFNACQRGASRQERQRLEQEWLTAIHRMRTSSSRQI